jgi:hypothetical protein
MAKKIFEDKTTMDEALAQWPQRTALGMFEPQNPNRPLPGFKITFADVKHVERPRKGRDY